MFVYALYNEIVDKIYVGQTNDLDRRIQEHNLKKGNHFTAKFRGEWKLIYSESVTTRTEALKREKQLKTGNGRDFIKQHIPE